MLQRKFQFFLNALRLEFRAQQERGEQTSDSIRSEDESTRDSTTSSELSSRPDLSTSLENGHGEPMETESAPPETPKTSQPKPEVQEKPKQEVPGSTGRDAKSFFSKIAQIQSSGL